MSVALRTVSISATRIVRDDEPRRAPLRRAPPAVRAGGGTLATRRAGPHDLPWIETWSAGLGLPAPSAGTHGYVLLENGQRVGYLAAKDHMVDAGRGPERVRWIMSAFLVPAARGRGLLMRFGAMLSQEIYPRGRVGARIAATNTRMLKLMRVGGWTKVGGTRHYSDYVLALDGPFRGGRRGERG